MLRRGVSQQKALRRLEDLGGTKSHNVMRRRLQELVFEKESKNDVKLSFADLNGDRFEDLLLVGSYVEKCCLWSPLQKLYVDMTEELGGPFQEYVSDEENRQLWVFRRGFNRMKSNLYQWSEEGEPDCELLKEFSCILRYAQEETSEEDGTVLYTDRLFLFRRDTYLIGVYSGVVSSVPWEEISVDEGGRLRVTYEDGSSVVYSREFYE